MFEVICAHPGGPIRREMTLLTTNEIAAVVVFWTWSLKRSDEELSFSLQTSMWHFVPLQHKNGTNHTDMEQVWRIRIAGTSLRNVLTHPYSFYKSNPFSTQNRKKRMEFLQNKDKKIPDRPFLRVKAELRMVLKVRKFEPYLSGVGGLPGRCDGEGGWFEH